MKKKILLMMMIAIALISCGDTKTQSAAPTEDVTKSKEAIELKSFMLGGMYFYNGFGGVSTVESQISERENKTKMIEEYREIFILPFTSDQADGIKNVFSKMWDINSKSDLEATLKKLLNGESKKPSYKAWDYARLVNNACMGYAAGYLTEQEAKHYAAEALVAAQKNFKTWDDYLKDYNEGRNAWDPEAEDKEEFDKVTSEMLTTKDGIYSFLPLN